MAEVHRFRGVELRPHGTAGTLSALVEEYQIQLMPPTWSCGLWRAWALGGAHLRSQVAEIAARHPETALALLDLAIDDLERREAAEIDRLAEVHP